MTSKRFREDIIRRAGANSDYRPHVAVDASVWIRQCLCNPQKNSKVSSQFHANPPVPVVAVSTSVMKKAAILRKNKFDVILVFDGTDHPLK